MNMNIDGDHRQLSDDASIEAFLEDLGFDSDYEGEGMFRILAASESEAQSIKERIISALRAHIEDFGIGYPEWMVDSWALDGVPWTEFGEDVPVNNDGAPVPYAVVVACPWRPGGTWPFEDLIEHLLEDYSVDFERVGERAWRLQYKEATQANPARVVERLKRMLGWWQCYGLIFVASKAGSIVHLQIKD